jgi:putative transcriptional regulator
MHSNIVEQKRKELGLTQEEMAERLNVSRQHYNAVENFKKPPSVELAKNLGSYLNIDWTIFFIDKVNE